MCARALSHLVALVCPGQACKLMPATVPHFISRLPTESGFARGFFGPICSACLLQARRVTLSLSPGLAPFLLSKRLPVMHLWAESLTPYKSWRHSNTYASWRWWSIGLAVKGWSRDEWGAIRGGSLYSAQAAPPWTHICPPMEDRVTVADSPSPEPLDHTH